jgi:Ni,Fe-hydrogenase I small subunit
MMGMSKQILALGAKKKVTLVNHHSFIINHLGLSPKLTLLWVHLTSIATLLHSILTSTAPTAAPVVPTTAT